VNKATDEPLFRVNDRRGFLIAAEARVKKGGSSSPKLTVSCGLKHFDLVMVSPVSFLELNFEKIEFSVDSNAKTNVDVLLSDIKFIGVLSFVETLRDLIPLDGFSDPPYLDVSAKGIDAGFSLALPSLAIGVLNISNLSLGAGFTVPFIGQPLSVRFNFCTREQPFNLTVSMFGGGGFFGVTVDPTGVQILEAAFEFGASVSVNFGVASGGRVAGRLFPTRRTSGCDRADQRVDRALSGTALRIPVGQVRRQGAPHHRNLDLPVLGQRHHHLRAQVRRLERRSDGAPDARPPP
jgi:hypothetical protein